jgi:hypothetical protein
MFIYCITNGRGSSVKPSAAAWKAESRSLKMRKSK